MGDLGFDKETIRWEDHTIHHDPKAFPNLERVVFDGNPVQAYSDRPDSIYGLFREAVEEAPDRDFLVFPDNADRYTYQTVFDRVDLIASGLREQGVSRGDRVVVVLSNSIEFVEVFLAASRIGAVFVPLNPQHTTSEFDHILDTTDPEVLVLERSFLEPIEQGGYPLDPLETFLVGETGEYTSYSALVGTSGVEIHPPTERAACCILFTSGTTGLPKGVPANHFHLVNGALNNAFCFGLSTGTTGLFPTPLFHVMALTSGLLATTTVAGTSTILRDYTPERFLQAIETEKPSYVMAVPTNYVLAVEKGSPDSYDTNSLETFAYGGAPMPEDSLVRIREAFPKVTMCNSYGKTESVSGLAAMVPGPYTEANPDSVGIPTPVMEFRVVDEDSEPLPPGRIGELLMYGPIIVDGYLDHPTKSAAEFEDGWHYTGDVGTIDQDGFIRLLGRKDDLIIRGGENIYPSEVKDVLLGHERVIEASVTGFPDDVLGQRVLAGVVPSDDGRLTEDELESRCEAHLPAYKVPDVFRILSELPRNAAGTVDKDALVPEPLEYGIKAARSEPR